MQRHGFAKAAQLLPHLGRAGARSLVRLHHHAQHLQLPHDATLQPLPWVLAAPVPPGPGRAGQRAGAQQQDQRRRQVLPVGGLKAQVLQQVELLAARIVQHPLVPAVVDGFQGRAHLRCKGRVDAVHGAGNQTRRRAQAAAALHALRGHGGRRVDAHPAHVGLPDLSPGVGVALAHDDITVLQVGVGALVAGDHARWHVHGAHDDHEGAGVVFAEAQFAVEPEVVDGVAAVRPGLQRVGVAAAADVGQHGVGQRARVGIQE